MPSAPLILIVEDEYDIVALLAAALSEQGYLVAVADKGSVGADILRARLPALLIANVRLRGGNGEPLATLAHDLGVPVLLISGDPEAIEKHRGGPIPFLSKPFRLADLEREVEGLVRRD